jgi:voltage-dependent calcium channel L type alpha-1D
MPVSRYFQDRMRQFDFFIVAISIIEMMALPPSFATGVKAGAGGLSALRAFRILRVFRLAKKWKSFSMLLAVIADTLKNVAYFGVLLFLFMYIAALVGMQFFATKMHFDEKGRVVAFGEPGWDTATVPRSNFDSLLWALVTVFQILSGENWNVAMYDGMRATNWVASLYFVSIIVVGKWWEGNSE